MADVAAGRRRWLAALATAPLARAGAATATLAAALAAALSATRAHAEGVSDDALRRATGPDWAPWRGGATPALDLPALDGAAHTLAQARGQVVLLSFWASWCEPCRDEFPEMAALVRAQAGRGLRLWAVNHGESRPRIDAFLARFPLPDTVLHDRNGTAARDWRVLGMPANYLVDRKGRLRYWHLGALDWRRPAVVAAVTSLLDEPA
ncbi:thiol-disulfide oxidoreductase [Bordetella genomosp. 1]|uniref:Thiol-disulfide oxidoreductase n=1 Tax=Bordetella genomosp. 1 TaxID=1395607 RepID=A0A261SU13_9BORD|nr:TlpA disulfide reductase family protein [Bordetella genomosp. 1]OZI40507.1 thiol-disulfide oxidoreductase [Bordetella genomosp. 1]